MSDINQLRNAKWNTRKKTKGCCAERSTSFIKPQKASQGDGHGADTKRTPVAAPGWSSQSSSGSRCSGGKSTPRSYFEGEASMPLALYGMVVGVCCCDSVGGGVGVGGLVRSGGGGVLLIVPNPSSLPELIGG